MISRALITSCALFFIMCHREDLSNDPSRQITYGNKEIIYDTISFNIYNRSGVTPNFIFHPSSWTTDSYFLNSNRVHKIYNHNVIDSIKYVRVNESEANVGFLVSNYDIKIFYKNGYIDFLKNYLCPISYGDEFTQDICINPLNKSGIVHIHSTTFERSVKTIEKHLPYRGFQKIKLYEWIIYTEYNGIIRLRDMCFKEPENSISLQWQPKHIL
jgi:hypothetical protein